MSTTRAPALPPQLTELPAPETVAEAIGRLHHSAGAMQTAAEKLLELAQLQDQCPEMRTVVINEGNNGRYQTLDKAPWVAKSVGILNPGAAPVFVGIAGQSATAAARVPPCPGSSALVLPVEAGDLLLGCDPSVLGASTAVIFLFRYVSVQPLVLRQVP